MTDKTIYIGIDGGNNGALVGLQGNKMIFKVQMPVIETTDSRKEYDCTAIVDLLSKYKDATVILEKAHAMPKLGTIQAFNFGKSFGVMIGILSALRIRYHIVHARTWQTLLFRDQPHGDTKKASVVVAQRLFPGENFFPTARCKKAHDGLTDATLIAYYGQNYLYSVKK
jgi:crossover junction endodeoxyribonuclease RuvC